MIDGHVLYLEAQISAAVVCTICAVLMLRSNRWLLRLTSRSPHAVPRRYVMARDILAAAYLAIALLNVLRVSLDMPSETVYFLPLSALVITSTQAVLFTGALLALYDSRLLRFEVVVGNLMPFVLLLLLYDVAWREEMEWLKPVVRHVWLALYALQLVVYTAVFFRERRKYLDMDEALCGESHASRRRHDRIICVLFVCSLVVGMLALASYFFSEEWQEAVFVISYTAYYFAVADYFLCYETRYGDRWIHRRLTESDD